MLRIHVWAKQALECVCSLTQRSSVSTRHLAFKIWLKESYLYHERWKAIRGIRKYPYNKLDGLGFKQVRVFNLFSSIPQNGSAVSLCGIKQELRILYHLTCKRFIFIAKDISRPFMRFYKLTHSWILSARTPSPLQALRFRLRRIVFTILVSSP